MSLTKAKIVYYAVIAIPVVLLILIGGVLDWIAAGSLAVAAPILLKVICSTSAQENRNKSEFTFDLIITETSGGRPDRQAPYPE